jgi:hypothetical protein
VFFNRDPPSHTLSRRRQTEQNNHQSSTSQQRYTVCEIGEAIREALDIILGYGLDFSLGYEGYVARG